MLADGFMCADFALGNKAIGALGEEVVSQAGAHIAHWQQQLSCSFMTYTLYQASWRGRVSPIL